MKPRHAFMFAVVCALLVASRAEDRAPAPATPPANDAARPAETKPAETAAASATPAATTPTPTVTPAAGSSVLAKLRLPPTASKTKEAIKPPPLSPRFKQVREHIAALFDGRGEPPPPVDPAKNPFRTPGAAPVVVAPPASDGNPAPVPIVSSNDLSLLQQGAAQLKVTGFVEREGRTLLTINQTLYREGDVIKVSVRGQLVYLRLTKLSRTSLTLTLNDAEMTLKF